MPKSIRIQMRRRRRRKGRQPPNVEDEPPESPALIDWKRFDDNNQDADSEPDEERAARIVADDDRRLEELLIMHADIADVLVMYERPLVTDIERRLLVSQPPGVSDEDCKIQETHVMSRNGPGER